MTIITFGSPRFILIFKFYRCRIVNTIRMSEFFCQIFQDNFVFQYLAVIQYYYVILTVSLSAATDLELKGLLLTMTKEETEGKT